MEDKFNTGETKYFTPAGKEITEKEYRKLQKITPAEPDADVNPQAAIPNPQSEEGGN